MQETPGATALLAAFVAANPREPLPRQVSAKAAYCLLDAVGLVLLARDEKTATAINALLGIVNLLAGVRPNTQYLLISHKFSRLKFELECS
jgi:2-methylcitrate dehydratase PrpD